MTDADYRVKVAERLASIEVSQREMKDDQREMKADLGRIEGKLDGRLAKVETRVNRFAGGVAAVSGLVGIALAKLWDRLG